MLVPNSNSRVHEGASVYSKLSTVNAASGALAAKRARFGVQQTHKMEQPNTQISYQEVPSRNIS